jgi:hypothetical protein
VSVPTPRDEPPQVAAHVQVVRGAPDEVELAALVAGLVASAGNDDEPPAVAAEWSSRRRALPQHPAPAPGPDAWRWSLHP